jgi:hypothetical protein
VVFGAGDIAADEGAEMSTEKLPDGTLVHVDSSSIREGILDHQVEKCPTCKGSLIDGFGLAGGGFGVYGYCDKCNRVVWKYLVDE